MRRFRFACLLMGLSAVCAAEPNSCVEIVDVTPGAKITLATTDRPAAEVVGRIARKLGFEEVVVKDPAIDEMTVSCDFKDRPAWDCLVELFTRHGLTFGGGDLFKDYALTLYRDTGKRFRYRTATGLVARFSQKPAGTAAGHHTQPCQVWIRDELGLGWSMKRIEVCDAKDAKGLPVDVLRFALFSGRPQLSPRPDGERWPGLSAFTLKAKVDYVTRRKVVRIEGLSAGMKAHPVLEDGRELMRVDRVARRHGRFDIEISWPSTSEDSMVAQGGHGSPAGAGLSFIAGWDAALHHAATGKRLIPSVISAEGNGTRMRLKLGIRPNRAPLGAVRVTLLKTLETQTRDVTFAFTDLK